MHWCSDRNHKVICKPLILLVFSYKILKIPPKIPSFLKMSYVFGSLCIQNSVSLKFSGFNCDSDFRALTELELKAAIELITSQ